MTVEFRSAAYTHSYEVIQQLNNFVSSNGAMQVDSQGQVTAELAGGRQISGTDGFDFMRAARASRGGESRIVPQVEHVAGPDFRNAL